MPAQPVCLGIAGWRPNPTETGTLPVRSPRRRPRGVLWPFARRVRGMDPLMPSLAFLGDLGGRGGGDTDQEMRARARGNHRQPHGFVPQSMKSARSTWNTGGFPWRSPSSIALLIRARPASYASCPREAN